MSKVFGFVGKGGVGKSTIAALFLKRLLDMNKTSIMVVDSDPNECIPGVLGIKKYMTLSDIVDKYKGGSINPVAFEQEFESMLLVNEQSGYDLVVMGRGEEEGCYCVINHLLRSSFEKNILKGKYNYDYVIMDCEAGLEHISRRTSAVIHDLIIITDSSKAGIDTIERIVKVSKSVKTSHDNIYIIANRTDDEKSVELIKSKAEQLNVKFLGSIPNDSVVSQYNSSGKSLLELPEKSAAYQSLVKIFDKIMV